MHVETCAPLVSILLSLGFDLYEEDKKKAEDGLCVHFLTVKDVCEMFLQELDKGVRELRGNLMYLGTKCERKQHVSITKTGYVLDLS